MCFSDFEGRVLRIVEPQGHLNFYLRVPVAYRICLSFNLAELRLGGEKEDNWSRLFHFTFFWVNYSWLVYRLQFSRWFCDKSPTAVSFILPIFQSPLRVCCSLVKDCCLAKPTTEAVYGCVLSL